MSTRHNNTHLRQIPASPTLLLALLTVACEPSPHAPSSTAADLDAFTLDGPEALAVHTPTGLGLAVGALGANLNLNGAEVGFHTVGWGDSQGLEALESGDLELLCDTPADCDRAVAVHHAGLSEVWGAHPAGFEQSWVVDAPRGDDHQLVLEIEVEGASLHQIPGQTGIWLDPGGAEAIQYDGLHVLDADGFELPARMEVVDDHIRLIAGVAGAAWPVTVDPVVSTAEWTGVGSASWDNYGHAVSSGDYNGDEWPDLAVAALQDWGCHPLIPEGIGNVYVIYGSADGLDGDPDWPTTIIPAPSARTKCFGNELATGDFDFDGADDLAVGSPGDESFRGSVYIYKGSLTTGMPTTSSTTLTGISAGDEFGGRMDTGDLFGDGNMDLAVGSYKYNSNQGYVRLYRGPTPTLCRTLFGPSTWSGFGEEVELADVGSDGLAELLVGAAGAKLVRVYSVRTCGLTPYTTLTTPSGLLYFGSEIEVLYNGSAASADILVMGQTSAGVGRVYQFVGGVSPSATYLTDGVVGSQYGEDMTAIDVDLDGYTDLAVGARLAGSGTGQVFVYDNTSGTIGSPTTLSGPASGGYYGISLARMDDLERSGVGEDLAVGAQNASVAVGGASKTSNGAVYIHTGY